MTNKPCAPDGFSEEDPIEETLIGVADNSPDHQSGESGVDSSVLNNCDTAGPEATEADDVGRVNCEETVIVAATDPDINPAGATGVYVRARDDDDDVNADHIHDSLTSGRHARERISGRIIGEYELEAELGRGGMGVVFLARHRTLKRRVALKMVLSGRYSSPDARIRFVKEAQSVARLQHPGIVQIFDIGEHTEPGGSPLAYFALEFVEGGDLQKWLKGEPQPPNSAAELVFRLAETMQHAHDNGILHRDLKPANILLDAAGNPKISDFGLAREVDTADSGLTGDGVVVGSPSYMAPEQARGDLVSLSPRSDLYSLGAILYQMLTGRPPFLTDSAMSTILQVLNSDPVHPRELQPGIPVDLETICLKALQKDSAARYASCSELAADLGRFLQGEPILARPISRAERIWRWCRRNPKIAVPTALSTVLLIATAVISTLAFVQISAQATLITQERDDANTQRAIADRERDEANRQKQEADRQQAIALQNEQEARKEKQEADRQRILATEAKLQAEKNQQLAEQQAMLALKNIQFIVTDIDDRLAKQPGMSELRVELLQVVEKKWDELDVGLTGGIQGEAIPTLMAVRGKIADAWVSLDKLQQADTQYETLCRKARERLVIKNRSDASRFNLALVCIRWAPVRQRLTGDPGEAENLQSEADELMREILRDPRPEPGSPAMYQISDILQQSLMRTASLRMRSGQIHMAQPLFEEAAHINQNVLDEITDAAAWFSALPAERKTLIENYFRQNVDLARAGLANILVRRDQLEQAIETYDQLIANRQTNLNAAPNDRNVRDQLALQLRNYGQQMLLAGRVTDAVRLIGQSHDLTELNYREDPTSASSRQSHGYSLYYWGVAQDAAGQTEQALALLERSRALRQEILSGSPDLSSKVNLMLSESRLGNQNACEILIAELMEVDAKNPDLRIDIARALTQLSRRADDEAREQYLQRSLDVLRSAIEEGYSDAFRLEREPDLRPVNTRMEFQTLLTTLRKKQNERAE